MRRNKVRNENLLLLTEIIMDIKFVSHNTLSEFLKLNKKLVIDTGVITNLCSAYSNNEDTNITEYKINHSPDKSLAETDYNHQEFAKIFWTHLPNLELYTSSLCKEEINNGLKLGTENECIRIRKMLQYTNIIDTNEIKDKLEIGLTTGISPQDASLAQLAHSFNYPMLTCDRKCVRTLMHQLGTPQWYPIILTVWVFPSSCLHTKGPRPDKYIRYSSTEKNIYMKQIRDTTCSHPHTYRWKNQYTFGVKCKYCRKQLGQKAEVKHVPSCKCSHPVLTLSGKCWLCSEINMERLIP